MQYRYCKDTPEEVAENLLYYPEEKQLKWETANEFGTLIVQTPFEKLPFGKRADECCKIDLICEKMSEVVVLKQLQEHFLKIDSLHGVWVRFVPHGNRCELHQEGSTYTVFSCKVTGDVCDIFEPRERSLNDPYVYIKTCVRLNMKKQMIQKEIKEGFLGLKKRVEWTSTGFYQISVIGYDKNAYHDVDLYYEALSKTGKTIEIPLIKKVLEQKIFFIETSKQPVFKSKNNAIVVEQIVQNNEHD